MGFEPFTVMDFECQQRLSVRLFQLANAKRFHSSPLLSLVPKGPKFISYLNNLAGPGNLPLSNPSGLLITREGDTISKKSRKPLYASGLATRCYTSLKLPGRFLRYACHVHCRTCRFSSIPQPRRYPGHPGRQPQPLWLPSPWLGLPL